MASQAGFWAYKERPGTTPARVKKPVLEKKEGIIFGAVAKYTATVRQVSI